MELTPEVKASVLLQMLEFQMNVIHNSEELEKTWFEWAFTLLLATFGAVIALAGSSKTLQQALVVKIIATILILFPTLISIFVIRRQVKKVVASAEVAVRIEELLHLFDNEYFGISESLYPNQDSNDWRKLPEKVRKREERILYTGILILMALCVISTLWLIL